ncbi:hypothetical protein [Chitinibacter sp. GC72]|uniref:hypothetical protein n=1 Tax=Chitinibacter sp. GC72 TaxID=1526917 RepID=UPI0012FCE843|nr:hypothetical protein [Chitinibacter sp. GC72]
MNSNAYAQASGAGQWMDFNDAPEQESFEIIPKGTLVKVRMTLKPGGHYDPAQGWNDGYPTRSDDTGAIYLNAEFVVLDGPFAKRKLWTLIGLHSEKGPAWMEMGRRFIRAVLNSARQIAPADSSPQAQAARRITSFGDLDGIEFVARIDVEKDRNGDNKNVIHQAIEPGHKDYQRLLQGLPTPSAAPGGLEQMKDDLPWVGQTAASAAPAASPASPAGFSKPAWAQ